jgi:SAM-dependent methyltransferase
MLDSKKPIMTVPKFKHLVFLTDKIDLGIRGKMNDAGIYNHEVKESSPYIPFHHVEKLYELFSGIRRLEDILCRKISLLDVGAGTGRIVYLAKKCGISAKGIEFHKPYVEAGRKAFKLSKDELQVQNAFDLSVEFILQFGVIYTYIPIKDISRMTELHFSLVNKIQSFKEKDEEGIHSVIFTEMCRVYYPWTFVSSDTVVKSTYGIDGIKVATKTWWS